MNNTMMTDLKKIMVKAFLFAATGPLIGALCILPFFLGNEISKHGFSLEGIASAWLLITVFSYFLGVVPAFFTGLACSLLQDKFGGRTSLFLTVLAGVIISIIFGRVIGSDPLSSPLVLLMFAVPGGIASAFCSYIYRAKQRY